MIPQSLHSIWRESHYRPECVAGVNDCTRRRWGTFEVSVSNLWNNDDEQIKDEAPCWGAPGPLPRLHCLPEAVQDQEFSVSSLFPDTQEPSHVSLGNNMKWNKVEVTNATNKLLPWSNAQFVAFLSLSCITLYQPCPKGCNGPNVSKGLATKIISFFHDTICCEHLSIGQVTLVTF